MIPSYGTSLDGNVAATEQVLSATSHRLNLHYAAPEQLSSGPENTAPAAANDEGPHTANVVGK